MLRYHNITKDDMLNGDGLRVVLWLAGCEHKCPGCQNPVTWDKNGGLEVTDEVKAEIFEYLEKDYCDGITFSGGDPMACFNRYEVIELMKEIKEKFPNKTIWCYSGYTFEQLMNDSVVASALYNLIDVLVDGRYMQELRNVDIPWRGSTNQRVIDLKKTFTTGTVELLEGTADTTEVYVLPNVSCGC